MGFYDTTSNEVAQQRARKGAIETLARLEPLMEELDAVMRQEIAVVGYAARHPFMDGWYNLQKEYIAWQYEKGLVIKDPAIIIDILKDDK